MPSGRGWRWCQAIIEFGATRCTARKPLCESCPLNDVCAARPAIWGALKRLSRNQNPTYRYEGSNRYYRGRVLAVLRNTPEESIPLSEFGTMLREDFVHQDLSWLYGVVESLEKDGLVEISPTQDWSRPVAEERAAYGNERPDDPHYARTRVSLA